MSKFKVGDEVALKDPDKAKLFHDPSFIVNCVSKHSALHTGMYVVRGINSNAICTFSLQNLYLYTPENRTKILLGLDLED